MSDEANGHSFVQNMRKMQILQLSKTRIEDLFLKLNY